MISLYDVLLSASNIPVSDPIAEIWGRGLQGGYKVVEYTDSLPITINANGDALLDYRIYGASGVGERVDITGLSEPLCGIQTYTDSLDLSTGILTRRIKKFVLTGEETWWKSQSTNTFYIQNAPGISLTNKNLTMCSHFEYAGQTKGAYGTYYTPPTSVQQFNFVWNKSATAEEWKAYLAAQYAAGTPVTIWYVLAKPEVSTIPVPSGLTGTIEGYLIQDGTPTPETPIYPTANGVKQADGTYSIEYGYKLPMTVGNGDTAQTVPIYIGENQLDAIGEYSDYVDFGIQKIARKIREYTFTGNETFNLFAQNAYGTCWVNLRLYTTVAYCPIHQTTLRSSHFTAINNSDANFWYGYPQLDDACNFEKEDGYDTVKIFFRSTANFSTAEECKAYFKEQYDNGTPVKIWFVMKYTVGQYESTDNGKEDPPIPLPQIPTIEGETVIDYDGTPKPSQMYVKYKGKG